MGGAEGMGVDMVARGKDGGEEEEGEGMDIGFGYWMWED